MIHYISKLPPPEYTDISPRGVSILGSTGSIGRSALKVMSEQPDFFSIKALSAATNIPLLAEQATSLRPPFLAVLDNDGRKRLLGLLPSGYKPEILVGQAGYKEIASIPDASTVVSALVGAAGLESTAAAARAGKVIALANKESLVLAGPLLRDLCAMHGACILPVDSEHNAIFQCLLSAIYPAYISTANRDRLADKNIDKNPSLKRNQQNACRKLILTASGGPFRGMDKAFLHTVRKEQALKHPNWSMGAKISIDSATLMNKGLEVIEACMLYGISQDKIDVLVHPQSVVHSLVEFIDGSMLAQLGPADMRVPIANCLGWPYRINSGVPYLDLLQLNALTFEKPDNKTFPCLNLCRMALDMSAGATIVLNAANEIAVELFLNDKISFTHIPELIEKALEKNTSEKTPQSVEEILDIDKETRQKLRQ